MGWTFNLDNNATTPVLPEVKAAMIDAMMSGIANPSSLHREGRAARELVEESRDAISKMFDVDTDRIVFTAGATEGNDAVLRAHSDHVLLMLAGGHPSLIKGHTGERELLNADKQGVIVLEDLRRLLTKDRQAIVAISMVSGETGVIQPAGEICSLCRDAGVPVLVDLAQAVGRVPSALLDCGADYRTVSAHKMNGPKGVGCLLLGDAATVPAMTSGGGQEGGRRSGTENVPGIAGFAAAARARHATLDSDLERMAALRDELEQGIIHALPFVHVNGAQGSRAATTTSLTFEGIDGMALMARLDASGVMCSQVSACSSGRPEPSAALMSIGMSERDAFSTVRLSVSVMTSTDDVREATAIIVREAGLLHDIMGGAG